MFSVQFLSSPVRVVVIQIRLTRSKIQRTDMATLHGPDGNGVFVIVLRDSGSKDHRLTQAFFADVNSALDVIERCKYWLFNRAVYCDRIFQSIV